MTGVGRIYHPLLAWVSNTDKENEVQGDLIRDEDNAKLLIGM